MKNNLGSRTPMSFRISLFLVGLGEPEDSFNLMGEENLETNGGSRKFPSSLVGMGHKSTCCSGGPK